MLEATQNYNFHKNNLIKNIREVQELTNPIKKQAYDRYKKLCNKQGLNSIGIL